ncbi:MAG: 16S rRNA (uracil(1498)-N(3))-methyltransferase [Coraliomargarita sp.]
MNLILFNEPFEQIRLEVDDPRAKHIRKVLRAQIGTKVFLGFVNGLRARAEVAALPEDGSVFLEVVGTEPAPKPLPITLLIGLPRPHTAKRILFEAASLGVQRMYFFEAERGEPSYAQSSLWTSNEWQERLHLGVEQSFGTHVPEVATFPDLQTVLSLLYEVPVRVALDNYEAAGSLNATLPESAEQLVLAFGPERGWSPNERDTLRNNGWKLAHLGPHVLRAETATVAAVSAAAAQLGYWEQQTATEL